MNGIVKVTAPYLDGAKDPNDARDNAAFRELIESEVAHAKSATTKLDWASGFTITTEEAEEMTDPDFLYPNLIIAGHVIVIAAEPNGGKTTIFVHVAGELSDSGYTVYYVNADTSGGDAKALVRHSHEHGYQLLLPDLAGRSMDEVITNLAAMNDQPADYSGTVFIFDTLKKMTDVINKSRAKELYKLFRGLSGKGMTIILLAHTNKYKDADGKPIYEGTGDLRSDVDELIYLIPQKHGDGSMTVSTEPDKVRGKFEPITFHISPDREVTLKEQFVDVLSVRQAEIQREHDQPVIEAITESITTGKFKHLEIREHCKTNHGIGWRTVESVLARYRHSPIKLWDRERGFQNNSWVYHLANSTPPKNDNSGDSGNTGNSGYTQ